MNEAYRQEIDLLRTENQTYQPKISFRVASLCSFLFFSALMFFLWNQSHTLKNIEANIKEIEKNNMFQQAKVLPLADVGKYEGRLKTLEQQLLDRYQLWANYQKITMTGKEGFSKHFFHIAQLSHKDLSLYEIDLYNKGKNLALKGYARKAEYIPVYINELKKQSEFENVEFGALNIEKIKDHNVMRFSLEKIEEEKPQEKFEERPNINISDLMGMPLVNQLNTTKILNGRVAIKESSQ